MRAIAAAVALCLLAGGARAADEAMRGEVAAVVDLFYAHDFDAAASAGAALASKHPGHPVGPLYRAIVAYQRWMASGLLDESAWSDVDRDLSLAIAEASALEASSPAESHYYLGAALGFRARGLAARRHFLAALPDAASSIRHLRKALALDPSLTDAELGLGMYHYFAARMPAPTRPFAYLLAGESGDRDKGLAELWSVAKSSGPACMEARAVLSMILSRNDEADWDGAEKLLAELMTRYPRNPVARLRRVYVAQRRGDLEQAAALADPDGAWLPALHPSGRANARAWALYRLAECRLLQGRPGDAAPRLAALNPESAPSSLRDWIFLRRGNLEDALGRRDAARAEYARVQRKPAAALAARFLDEPFPAGPRDVAPFFAGY